MARRKRNRRGRGGQGEAPPEAGQIVQSLSAESLGVLLGEIKPERAIAIMRAAAAGDPSSQEALFNAMLERDGHLASVYRQRLTALTGKGWELLPADQAGKSPRIDESLAASAHDYCLEILAEMEGFDGGLAHLAEAIGRSTSVVEMIWEKVDGAMRPVEIAEVPFTQLIADRAAASQLRVLTGEGDYEGLPLCDQPGGKFIVHSPNTLGGNCFQGGLLRCAVIGFIAKNFGIKWWLEGVDRYGMPMTIAKYPEGSGQDVKNNLLAAIKNMAGARGGVFPLGTEIELITREGKGAFPHEALLKYVDAQHSKEFVGQTLTTEIGETGGARAAAAVHDDVRDDLTRDDARKEGATLREQLLIPMVRYHFGEDAAIAAPYFRRVFEESKDLREMGELISIAVNKLGAQVPAGTVEEELGIKLVDDADRAAPLPGEPSGFGTFANSRKPPAHASGAAHDVVANRALTEVVARHRSAVARLVGWIIAATLASQAHARSIQEIVLAEVERQPDLAAVQAALPGMFADLPIEDLVALENHLLMAGQLAGRAEAQSAVLANSTYVRRIVNAGKIDFASIPFAEAVDALRDRLGLDPEEFLTLDAEARSRAWRVAGVWNMQLLSDIHRELTVAIEAGETSRDFRLRLPEMMERRGWTGENPWHADLVQFQNFTMSHAAGRYRQYVELGVKAWRFVASGDSCPICEALVGKVFAMSDRRFFPPLHFWCDCEGEPVFEDELQDGELQDSGEIANPAFDTEQARSSGLKWDPAQYANLEPMKLSGFPEPLRAEFEAFAKRQGWEVTQ